MDQSRLLVAVLEGRSVVVGVLELVLSQDVGVALERVELVV